MSVYVGVVAVLCFMMQVAVVVGADCLVWGLLISQKCINDILA